MIICRGTNETDGRTIIYSTFWDKLSLQRSSYRLLSSPIYSDAVERLIGKLLIPDHLTSNERKECLAEMTTLFFDEHQMFMNQTGI